MNGSAPISVTMAGEDKTGRGVYRGRIFCQHSEPAAQCSEKRNDERIRSHRDPPFEIYRHHRPAARTNFRKFFTLGHVGRLARIADLTSQRLPKDLDRPGPLLPVFGTAFVSEPLVRSDRPGGSSYSRPSMLRPTDPPGSQAVPARSCKLRQVVQIDSGTPSRSAQK